MIKKIVLVFSFQLLILSFFSVAFASDTDSDMVSEKLIASLKEISQKSDSEIIAELKNIENQIIEAVDKGTISLEEGDKLLEGKRKLLSSPSPKNELTKVLTGAINNGQVLMNFSWMGALAGLTLGLYGTEACFKRAPNVIKIGCLLIVPASTIGLGLLASGAWI